MDGQSFALQTHIVYLNRWRSEETRRDKWEGSEDFALALELSRQPVGGLSDRRKQLYFSSSPLRLLPRPYFLPELQVSRLSRAQVQPSHKSQQGWRAQLVQLFIQRAPYAGCSFQGRSRTPKLHRSCARASASPALPVHWWLFQDENRKAHTSVLGKLSLSLLTTTKPQPHELAS